MSDHDEDCDFINVPAETPLTPDEAIVRRHRREKRDMQGKILGMKKTVNKADKKRKKEIAEEIVRLETELETRHKAELETFLPGKPVPLAIPSTVCEADELIKEKVINGVKNAEIEQTAADDKSSNAGSAPGTPKMSRARRRREKKEAEERDKRKRIDSESALLLDSSQMKTEEDILEKMMKDLKLDIVDIAPDGNCLYNAVKDQLGRCGESTDVQTLRSRVAEYLRSNKDEFISFLDEAYASDEGFETYCNDVESTTTWGGQLEVRILSQILERPVKVIQAAGVPVCFGETFSKTPLILTYHRHKYQLGEHYNSTLPINS